MRAVGHMLTNSRPIAILLGVVFLSGMFGSATLIAAADTATSTPSAATSTVPETVAENTGTTSAALAMATSTTVASDIVATTSSITATTSPIVSAATSTGATSSPSEPLTCTAAYVADLYNTHSGHLDPGYVLSTTTGAGVLATRIGTQAWTDCKDSQGNKYEFKLTPEQYASLESPNALMPQEFADPSAELGAREIASTSTPISTSDIPEDASTTAASTPAATSTATALGIIASPNEEEATSTSEASSASSTTDTNTITATSTTAATVPSINNEASSTAPTSSTLAASTSNATTSAQ